MSSFQVPQWKHLRSMLLSWVAHWCNVGVQLCANFASWKRRPAVRFWKEDCRFFQSMLSTVESAQLVGMNGSFRCDFSMSRSRIRGAVVAVVTYSSCFLDTSLPLWRRAA
jgi:hypothetical protein